MARIDNLNDFKNQTSTITSFSHAYLFNVNSLDKALPYIKEFAKMIVIDDLVNEDEAIDIAYKIDHDEFDDLYIVNPNTIGINTEEINKLMNYMETKSVRNNGKRVYIIFGFERLSRDVSNKMLKFLEEPNENIYALLMTENFEKILPTIVSRCQVLNFTFPTDDVNIEIVDKMKEFLSNLIEKKKKMIAYEYDYFYEAIQDRVTFYQYFEVIEQIISESLNSVYSFKNNENYVCGELLDYPTNTIINILDITNRLKCLIKGNINLNLLIDRYIIEVTEELVLCKE